MGELVGSTYELLERIGSGGGGIVYLANHVRLHKKIVLKADKRTLTTSSELLRREVDILKDLSHPYIPKVYDFFTEGETVYTAMDFIDGESLDKVLERGMHFSQPQVIRWAIQLLEALEYLHSPTHGIPPRGYIHSDIKPANIMLRGNGDICLIDFNISLALGEKNVIGISQGYASPEHYGLDLSNGLIAKSADDGTVLIDAYGKTVPAKEETDGKKRIILPDVRSDIYSLGATLYHLLTGQRPAQDARKVLPITNTNVSPAVAEIIQKAMAPDPTQRYQSAEEMLNAFESLHEHDPRTRRHKRYTAVTAAVISVVFLLGGLSTLIGLQQMKESEAQARLQAETAEKAQRLAKDALTNVTCSETAYQNGDITAAIDYAVRALAEDTPYTARAQTALTQALGVYELSDGFQSHLRLTLPSEPLKVVFSPEGTRLAVMVSGELLVLNPYSGETVAALKTESSALSDVVFVDEDTILYAGSGALRAYHLVTQQELWHGKAATSIALSGNRAVAAAVYRDENIAAIYDVRTGAALKTVTFQTARQNIVENDLLADPEDDLFVLNEDGSLLAVSFANGGLKIFDLQNSQNDIELFEASEFTHFEGGFYQQYLAFSAIGGGHSLFTVIDTIEKVQTGGFTATMPFHVLTRQDGIYLSTENILVKIDPVSGEQTEVAYTEGEILQFDTTSSYTITATENDTFAIFNSYAQCLEEFSEACDFVKIAGNYAAAANLFEPTLRLLRLEDHTQAQVLTYDGSYVHNEARISEDGNTVMLFRYDGFRLYHRDGTVVAEVEIPNATQVYDQQYRRDERGSRLEVIYNNGFMRSYSAMDGTILDEVQGNVPDDTLYEEFFTEHWKITAPLHGAPAVYDKETDVLLCELEQEGYLTYVTQVGDGVVTEYITADGERYGLLLNEACETVAYLPNLCDITADGILLFDDLSGNLRQSRIYSIQELLALAKY